MSTPDENNPVDPVADPSLGAEPPTQSDAVAAAEQMNDPDGAQPGVSENPPVASDDDPLPEPMQ